MSIAADTSLYLNDVLWDLDSTKIKKDASSIYVTSLVRDESDLVSLTEQKLPNISFYRQDGTSTTYKKLDALYDGQNKDVSLYFRNLEYMSPYTSSSTDTSSKAYTIFNTSSIGTASTMRVIKSGDNVVSLIGETETKSYNTINIKTINGKSLIFNSSLPYASKYVSNWYLGEAVSSIERDIKLVTPKELDSSSSKITLQRNESTAILIGIDNPANYGASTPHNITHYFNSNIMFNNSAELFAQRFYQSSDERLKTNISEVEVNDYIPSIKQFDWIDSSIRSYGYIAQELEIYHPELVKEDANGIKKVDYDAAHSLAIAVLVKDNELLHRENLELKEELAQIKEMIKKLI